MPREPSSSPLTIRYWEIHPAWEYQFFFSRQSYGPSQPSYQMHDHDFFEFFLVESGNVVHRINGETEILRPGDLRLILPRDTHQLVPEKGKEFSIYNCNIETMLFQNCFHLLTGGGLSPDDLRHTIHPNEADRRALLDGILHVTLYQNTPKVFQTRLAGRVLIVQVLKMFLELHDEENDRPQWLERLCIQMQKSENLQCGVHRMFELTNYTPAHVSRSIKKYLGITPSQLVLQYKLQKVVRDLTYTSLSINRIALQNGFRNYAYFHNSFVKQYGCTPLHYRKNFVLKNAGYSHPRDGQDKDSAHHA